jgi:hypothetical protein
VSHCHELWSRLSRGELPSRVTTLVTAFSSPFCSSNSPLNLVRPVNQHSPGIYKLLGMSKDQDQDQGRAPSLWSNNQYNLPNGTQQGIPVDSDPVPHRRNTLQPTGPSKSPYSAPPASVTRFPDRPKVPTRSSTLGSGPDHNPPANDLIPHARSEDLNHGSSSNSHRAGFSGSSPRPPAVHPSAGGGSRPSTPPGSNKHNHPSSSSHSDDSDHPTSVTSFSSAHSGSSSHSSGAKVPPTSSTSTSLAST